MQKLKSKSRKIIFFIGLFLPITLIFITAMTQNSNASGFFDIFKPGLPKPPIWVPFDITKKGNKSEMTFRITKDTGCVFGITFRYKEGDRVDKDRVRKLTGSMGRDILDDKGMWLAKASPEHPGIPTIVRLKIFLITDDNSKVIYNEELDPVLGSWGADNLTKILKVILLKPGTYKAEVESLNDIPELVGEKIEFELINPKR